MMKRMSMMMMMTCRYLSCNAEEDSAITSLACNTWLTGCMMKMMIMMKEDEEEEKEEEF